MHCQAPRWLLAGTFKEILAVAQQASQKDVGRSYRAIEKFLQEQANEKGATVNGQGVGVLHVTDLLRRYCSALGLGHTDMRHATAIADAACPRDAGYVPRFGYSCSQCINGAGGFALGA